MVSQMYFRMIASPLPGAAVEPVTFTRQQLELSFRVGGQSVPFRFVVDALHEDQSLRSPAACAEYSSLAETAWARYQMLSEGPPYTGIELRVKLERAVVVGRTFRRTAAGGEEFCGLSVISRVVLGEHRRQPMKIYYVETDFVDPKYWHAGIGKAQVRHLLEALSKVNGREGYMWVAATMQNPVMYGAIRHHPQVNLVCPDVESSTHVPAPYDLVMPELALAIVGHGKPVVLDYDPDHSVIRGSLTNHPTRIFRSVADMPRYKHQGSNEDPLVNAYFARHLFDQQGNGLPNDILVLFRYQTS